MLQLFIDNLKSTVARAINESSSIGIVIDVNLSTFQVTITFSSPAQATAFRNLVNSGAFVFNFHAQTLVATLVVTTAVAPTTAPECPTVGVNTPNWAPWSTFCGHASRVLHTLNFVAATPSVYGSHNPYSACNVSCIQSASYDSRSIRCPCVGSIVATSTALLRSAAATHLSHLDLFVMLSHQEHTACAVSTAPLTQLLSGAHGQPLVEMLCARAL